MTLNVQELFRRLSYGEFSNLSLGSDGTGSITAAKRNSVIKHTNEALLRLFSRFVLRENDLVLQTSEFITSYHFRKQFAATNDDPCPGTTLYILDEGDPFQEDLIKVMSVYDRENCLIPLNDVGKTNSLFTPQPNVLQVPMPVEGEIMTVLYQARHPIIEYDDLEACIDIPAVLEGALTAYVAHLVYLNMNGQDNQAQAQTHLARYETICAETIERDLVSSSSSTSTYKFEERGFV